MRLLTQCEEACLTLISEEFRRAREKHPRFNSAHEGIAVIQEKYDELWDEIKKKHPDKERMYEEAKQLAAMALRFMVEIAS